MPTSVYQVKFKLLGGATVTKNFNVANERDASSAATKIYKATRIISIKKVK